MSKPPPSKLISVERDGTSVKLTELRHDGDLAIIKFGIRGTYEWGFTLVQLAYGFVEDKGDIVFIFKSEDGDPWPHVVYSDDMDKHIATLRGIKPYPLLKAITYADDSFTVEFLSVTGEASSLTLGVFEGQHPYTLHTHGTNYWYARLRDQPSVLFFVYDDEDGKHYELSCTAPADEIERHMFELSAFNRSFEVPKSEAAYFPVTFLQAA